jgi:uncharacterized repeat protein (TIGR03803 family)
MIARLRTVGVFALIGATVVAAGVLASSRVASAQVSVEVLHAFIGGTDGARPYAALIQATDGNFYGTTQGDRGTATVFMMTPDGTTTTLHVFADPTGAANPHELFQATDGNLYGTTSTGGTFGSGQIFTLTLDGTFAVVYSFNSGPEGTGPAAALLQGNDGNFYGTTASGGGPPNSGGAVFSMTPDGTVTTLHAFPGSGTDGKYLSHPVIQASDGRLYGTTASGGAFDGGVVFRLALDGSFSILHHFGNATDGKVPGGLIQGTDGNLYGTTGAGGAFELGSVFTMSLDGNTYAVLHEFTGGTDDFNPIGALIQATDGDLYGTTGGGDSSAGTVFLIAPTGDFTTLYTFTGGADGGNPACAIVQGTDGNFYGTTYSGGDGLLGVVFRFATP